MMSREMTQRSATTSSNECKKNDVLPVRPNRRGSMEHETSASSSPNDANSSEWKHILSCATPTKTTTENQPYSMNDTRTVPDCTLNSTDTKERHMGRLRNKPKALASSQSLSSSRPAFAKSVQSADDSTIPKVPFRSSIQPSRSLGATKSLSRTSKSRNVTLPKAKSTSDLSKRVKSNEALGSWEKRDLFRRSLLTRVPSSKKWRCDQEENKEPASTSFLPLPGHSASKTTRRSNNGNSFSKNARCRSHVEAALACILEEEDSSGQKERNSQSNSPWRSVFDNPNPNPRLVAAKLA